MNDIQEAAGIVLPVRPQVHSLPNMLVVSHTYTIRVMFGRVAHLSTSSLLLHWSCDFYHTKNTRMSSILPVFDCLLKLVC